MIESIGTYSWKAVCIIRRINWQIVTILLLLITILILSIVLIDIKTQPRPIDTTVSITTQAPITTFTPTDYNADLFLYELTKENETAFSPGTVDILFTANCTPAYRQSFSEKNPQYSGVSMAGQAPLFFYQNEAYTPVYTRTLTFPNQGSCAYTFLSDSDSYYAVFVCDIQSVTDAEKLCHTLLCYRDYFPVVVGGSLSEEACELIEEVCRLDNLSQEKLLLTQNLSLTPNEDQASYPLFCQTPSKTLDPQKAMIALTYDDGPSSQYTPAVLDALEKHNVKATFFVLGCHIQANTAVIKRAFSLGCEIANHSNLHESFSRNTPSIIRKSIETTNSALRQVIGIGACLIRPPGGELHDRNQNALSVGYPIVLWNIDTYDYASNKTADDVRQTILSSLSDGSIVLMHDIHAPSANAADSLVEAIIQNGYQPVTVSELMEFSNNPPQNDTVYTSVTKQN